MVVGHAAANKRGENVEDSAISWILFINAPSHLHVIRIHALDGFKFGWQVELRGVVTNNLRSWLD
jgi:hypothetical protein